MVIIHSAKPIPDGTGRFCPPQHIRTGCSLSSEIMNEEYLPAIEDGLYITKYLIIAIMYGSASKDTLQLQLAKLMMTPGMKKIHPGMCIARRRFPPLLNYHWRYCTPRRNRSLSEGEGMTRVLGEWPVCWEQKVKE
jgi:hypothetical protein